MRKQKIPEMFPAVPLEDRTRKKGSPSEEKRRQAVDLFRHGIGYTKASRILDLSVNTVREWHRGNLPRKGLNEPVPVPEGCPRERDPHAAFRHLLGGAYQAHRHFREHGPKVGERLLHPQRRASAASRARDPIGRRNLVFERMMDRSRAAAGFVRPGESSGASESW